MGGCNYNGTEAVPGTSYGVPEEAVWHTWTEAWYADYECFG